MVRNVDPTRITLRFALTESDGSVRKACRRTLKDSHLLVSATAYPGDPLRYIHPLLRADAECDDPGAPEHLTFETVDELERLLEQRLEGGPGVEATPAFWAELRQIAMRRAAGGENA